MSNPQKRQGTSWEQTLIRQARTRGLEAWPLARRGPADPGDIAIRLPTGDVIVVEARNRENLTVHTELEKARQQTAHADLPFLPLMTVLAWKRLVDRGGKRRGQVGPALVAVNLDDFWTLIGGRS